MDFGYSRAYYCAALENAPAELRQSLSMQSIRKLILLCLIATISAGVSTGCVYRINIQQGNHIDPDAVDQLQQGMTKSQVQFLLGTPMIQDPFHPDRWDYVFYYKRGRDRNVEKKRLIVFFDEDVVREIVRDAPFDS
jgi:outer membrane protein assembly factor BamE